MLTVVAALIERDGKLLVCQRRRGDAMEFYWEFPGGKRKRGEKLQAALKRELREELGVRAGIGSEVYRTRYHYRGRPGLIELAFFEARVGAEEVRNRVFERIAWRKPKSLWRLDFLPADKGLVRKLAKGSIRIESSAI